MVWRKIAAGEDNDVGNKAVAIARKLAMHKKEVMRATGEEARGEEREMQWCMQQINAKTLKMHAQRKIKKKI